MGRRDEDYLDLDLPVRLFIKAGDAADDLIADLAEKGKDVDEKEWRAAFLEGVRWMFGRMAAKLAE